MTIATAPTDANAGLDLAAERERRAQLAPGPGWRLLGLDRGHGTPPAPPPTAIVAGLLDADQAAALGRYVELCATLDASRANEAELRAEVDRAAADDDAAAEGAYAAGAGTAPPSVAGARTVAADAQARYSRAALGAVADQLGAVFQAVASPEAQRQLVMKAWSALVEERKRTPQTMRRHVERVAWALGVQDRLSPNAAVPVVQAVDALPAMSFDAGLDGVLDELGAAVAGRLEELQELEQ